MTYTLRGIVPALFLLAPALASAQVFDRADPPEAATLVRGDLSVSLYANDYILVGDRLRTGAEGVVVAGPFGQVELFPRSELEVVALDESAGPARRALELRLLSGSAEVSVHDQPVRIGLKRQDVLFEDGQVRLEAAGRSRQVCGRSPLLTVDRLDGSAPESFRLDGDCVGSATVAAVAAPTQAPVEALQALPTPSEDPAPILPVPEPQELLPEPHAQPELIPEPEVAAPALAEVPPGSLLDPVPPVELHGPGRWVVVLGAFATESAAVRFRHDLDEKQIALPRLMAPDTANQLWRVSSGSFVRQEDAVGHAQRLRGRYRSAWVLRVGGTASPVTAGSETAPE